MLLVTAVVPLVGVVCAGVVVGDRPSAAAGAALLPAPNAAAA
jgi:hypothetical protein